MSASSKTLQFLDAFAKNGFVNHLLVLQKGLLMAFFQQPLSDYLISNLKPKDITLSPDTNVLASLTRSLCSFIMRAFAFLTISLFSLPNNLLSKMCRKTSRFFLVGKMIRDLCPFLKEKSGPHGRRAT